MSSIPSTPSKTVSTRRASIPLEPIDTRETAEGFRVPSPKRRKSITSVDGIVVLPETMAFKPDKIMLAFNGSVSSSCILHWMLELKYEVYCLICDIGQGEDVRTIENRALAIGATKVFVEDVKAEFVQSFVLRSIQANAVYDGRLLLGTALSRPCIARRQVKLATKEGCQYVAHGAASKTNDAVRFELAYYALDPTVKVLAPLRDPRYLETVGRTRAQVLEYAKRNNIEVANGAELSYNSDLNLFSMQRSGALLDDPNRMVSTAEIGVGWTTDPEKCPDTAETVTIEFLKGQPIKALAEGGRTATDAVGILSLLNEIGARNGIGRVDMVINQAVGVKRRVLVDTPGGSLLRAAHMDLEDLVMDREVRRLRDMMSPKFAELTFNGFWFSPEMEFVCSAVAKSQEPVEGTVTLRVFKGTAVPVARNSKVTLGSESYTTPDDATGYVHVTAARLRANAARAKQLK